MSDRYDDLTGPELAAELADRALSVTGKVGELRERLREDDVPEGADQGDTGPEVPEPRGPVDWTVQTLALTEGQARELTRREARLRAANKHVNPVSVTKYIAGDRVAVIRNVGTARVLPFGIEIDLDEEQD